MTRYNPFRMALLSLLALFIYQPSTLAAELPLPDDPHIVVTGYGAVEQVPDIIKVSFEASAVKENFSQAKAAVDTIIAKAIKAAGQQGIEADNINASKINAAPHLKNFQNPVFSNYKIQINRSKPIHQTAPTDAA